MLVSQKWLLLGVNLAFACTVAACSSDSDGGKSDGEGDAATDATGSGGSSSTGGKSGTGGATGSSGGTSSSGGSTASGGSGDDGGPGDSGTGGSTGTDSGTGGSTGTDSGTGGSTATDSGTGGSTATDSGTGGSTSTDAGCPSLGAMTPPTADASITPPSGVTLAQRFYAVGSQIYTCTATTETDAAVTYAWKFKEPDAVLYDDNCTAVGTHYLGPNWKSDADGSYVTGTKIAGVNSPTAGNIQWLLLGGVGHGTGIFDSITYVQRVDTSGGVTPTDACDSTNAGSDKNVPYTAVYYFYTGP